MSNANRNFIVAYILLVALPLACLGAVFKAGRKLTAPVSIDGTWNLEADLSQISSLACGKALNTLGSTFVISQSGKNFILTPQGAKVEAAGSIDGTELKARVLRSADATKEDACAAPEILLQASIDPKAHPKTLTGTISADGRTLEFRASLQNLKALKDGR